LKSGTLKLAIVPGYIRHVTLTKESDDYIQLYSAFPAHEGNLLDLRDIEQGLENLQRLPTVEASMEILPGEKPGESDVVITVSRARCGVSGCRWTTQEPKPPGATRAASPCPWITPSP
jgi:hemolysin activation/secretion protein